jgi:hypothetical protein
MELFHAELVACGIPHEEAGTWTPQDVISLTAGAELSKRSSTPRMSQPIRRAAMEIVLVEEASPGWNARRWRYEQGVPASQFEAAQQNPNYGLRDQPVA